MIKAIVFSYQPESGEGTFHKYGELNLVAEWYSNVKKEFIIKNCHKYAEELTLVIDENITYEDKNKILNCSGYVGTWWQQQDKYQTIDGLWLVRPKGRES